MRKRRSRNRRTKKWVPLAILGALAAISGALVFAAFAAEEPPATAQLPTPPRASATPEPTATEAPTTSVAVAVARLSDPAQPWAVTIVGDSTGNDGNEWISISARELSVRHDRPVELNIWDMTTASYRDTVRVGEGTGAPIVIWNAAAPGAGPQYALENLAGMTAAASELLIVSHGHNFTTSAAGVAQVQRIINDTATTWANSPAVSVVIQNPRTVDTPKQDANLAALRSAFDGKHALIDVETAWRAQDISTLLLDGVHPNDAGSALWVGAARSTLGW